MIRPLVQQLRRNGLRRRAREAVDEGVGVYNRVWPLGTDSDDVASLTDESQDRGSAGTIGLQVVDWCRFAMSQMRRPYGLDYVSLVISLISAENRHLAQVNFGILRPQEFYGDDGVVRRVEHALADWEKTGLLTSEGGDEAPKLAALLFSWGDLTDRLLLAG